MNDHNIHQDEWGGGGGVLLLQLHVHVCAMQNANIFNV